jgi:hypothetical protein
MLMLQMNDADTAVVAWKGVWHVDLGDADSDVND